jgi:hypothetical protein
MQPHDKLDQPICVTNRKKFEMLMIMVPATNPPFNIEAEDHPDDWDQRGRAKEKND